MRECHAGCEGGKGRDKGPRPNPQTPILHADHVIPRRVAPVDAGQALAQNVYLYCASAGLATVVRAWLDRKALAAALRLSGHEHVIVAQTIGYPA